MLFSGMLFLISLKTEAQINYVWALGDNEKIFRDDLQHPYKQGNAVWDGWKVQKNCDLLSKAYINQTNLS